MRLRDNRGFFEPRFWSVSPRGIPPPILVCLGVLWRFSPCFAFLLCFLTRLQLPQKYGSSDWKHHLGDAFVFAAIYCHKDISKVILHFFKSRLADPVIFTMNHSERGGGGERGNITWAINRGRCVKQQNPVRPDRYGSKHPALVILSEITPSPLPPLPSWMAFFFLISCPACIFLFFFCCSA